MKRKSIYLVLIIALVLSAIIVLRKTENHEPEISTTGISINNETDSGLVNKLTNEITHPVNIEESEEQPSKAQLLDTLYKDGARDDILLALAPKTPDEIYLDNIGHAMDGDGRAMYWVAMSLKACMGVRPKTEADEERCLSDIDVDWCKRSLKAAKADYTRCSNLIDMLSAEKLKDWNTHYEWIVKSHATGDILGSNTYFQIHPDQFKEPEAKAIVEKAFKTDALDSSTLGSLASYLVQYHGNVYDREYYNGYELALCSLLSEYCNLSNQKQLMSLEFLPSQISEIEANSKKILSAIDNADLDELLQ
ncbi:hypothetical protein [Halioxenophilus aromaticivorans]|uniref:Uncharacterized protein n=1 Tax=Halioxenophilus aromaticivorans TaxID=1306992 RepID=A0AAV3U0Z8_9ALTE